MRAEESRRKERRLGGDQGRGTGPYPTREKQATSWQGRGRAPRPWPPPWSTKPCPLLVIYPVMCYITIGTGAKERRKRGKRSPREQIWNIRKVLNRAVV